MGQAACTAYESVELSFEERLARTGCWSVRALTPTVMQMNVGYACNQQCVHCHIIAGPGRDESMSRSVMESSLDFAMRAGIREIDLTGGAPELHPEFRWFVENASSRGLRTTDRCNLTVLIEAGREDLPGFMAEHRVRMMASLPCYTSETTDEVRGPGAFERSIAGLRALNAVGYGCAGSGLDLILVHNPSGATLPGRQSDLEADYRGHLSREHGIEFTRLIAMANMPAGRFLSFLELTGELASYMRALERSFNPMTLDGLMCRTTISVRWDGALFDCDFNQCLGLGLGGGDMTIANADFSSLADRPIRCANHCYACTAGPGSGCAGEVTSDEVTSNG